MPLTPVKMPLSMLGSYTSSAGSSPQPSRNNRLLSTPLLSSVHIQVNHVPWQVPLGAVPRLRMNVECVSAAIRTWRATRQLPLWLLPRPDRTPLLATLRHHFPLSFQRTTLRRVWLTPHRHYQFRHRARLRLPTNPVPFAALPRPVAYAHVPSTSAALHCGFCLGVGHDYIHCPLWICPGCHIAAPGHHPHTCPDPRHPRTWNSWAALYQSPGERIPTPRPIDSISILRWPDGPRPSDEPSTDDDAPME